MFQYLRCPFTTPAINMSSNPLLATPLPFTPLTISTTPPKLIAQDVTTEPRESEAGTRGADSLERKRETEIDREALVHRFTQMHARVD